MHKYFPAIGFSNLYNKSDLMRLVDKVINEDFTRVITTSVGDNVLADFEKEIAPGIGIKIC